MDYKDVKSGVFLERPNRFIAKVLIDGVIEIVHVKNTGRCRELLLPGAKVLLEKAAWPERKTGYSLIAVYKGNLLINMDSQAPNKVVFEALQQGKLPEFGQLKSLAKEVTYNKSRFDLSYETESKQGFIEVKGVTLEQDGVALFPDAPTKRGTKHLLEMATAVGQGYEGCIFFLIQMKGPKRFQPNKVMDPKFAQALEQARVSGVKILAYDATVTPNSLELGNQVAVVL